VKSSCSDLKLSFIITCNSFSCRDVKLKGECSDRFSEGGREFMGDKSNGVEVIDSHGYRQIMRPSSSTEIKGLTEG
jgi:hypothetical protein